MRSQKMKEVLSEVSEFLEEGSNLELQDVLTMMEISRLDRIAETLESIDRSLKSLAGCIGSGGSFCITGDIISSDY